MAGKETERCPMHVNSEDELRCLTQCCSLRSGLHMLTNLWPQLYATAVRCTVNNPKNNESIEASMTGEVFINMATTVFASNSVIRVSPLVSEKERKFWETIYVREYCRRTGIDWDAVDVKVSEHYHTRETLLLPCDNKQFFLPGSGIELSHVYSVLYDTDFVRYLCTLALNAYETETATFMYTAMSILFPPGRVGMGVESVEESDACGVFVIVNENTGEHECV